MPPNSLLAQTGKAIRSRPVLKAAPVRPRAPVTIRARSTEFASDSSSDSSDDSYRQPEPIKAITYPVRPTATPVAAAPTATATITTTFANNNLGTHKPVDRLSGSDSDSDSDSNSDSDSDSGSDSIRVEPSSAGSQRSDIILQELKESRACIAKHIEELMVTHSRFLDAVKAGFNSLAKVSNEIAKLDEGSGLDS